MGKLIAINISEKRGTEKKEIQEAQLVTDFQRSQNRKRSLRGESDRLRI